MKFCCKDIWWKWISRFRIWGELVIQGTEVVEVLLERLRDKVKEVGGDGLIEFVLTWKKGYV